MFWDDCENQQKSCSEEAHHAKGHPALKLLAGMWGIQGVQDLATRPAAWEQTSSVSRTRGGGDFFPQWIFPWPRMLLRAPWRCSRGCGVSADPRGELQAAQPPRARETRVGTVRRGGSAERVKHRSASTADDGKTVILKKKKKKTRSWSSFFHLQLSMCLISNT